MLTLNQPWPRASQSTAPPPDPPAQGLGSGSGPYSGPNHTLASKPDPDPGHATNATRTTTLTTPPGQTWAFFSTIFTKIADRSNKDLAAFDGFELNHMSELAKSGRETLEKVGELEKARQ